MILTLGTIMLISGVATIIQNRPSTRERLQNLADLRGIQGDVGSTCETTQPEWNKPEEELSEGMKKLRKLCEKYGFIEIHEPNE